MSLPEPRLAAAEAEVARLRQALRDRDSDIVQEQIGDDALAEVERLREALEDAIGWIEPSLGGANAAQRARAALAASRTERAVMPNMRAPEPQPRNMTQTEGGAVKFEDERFGRGTGPELDEWEDEPMPCPMACGRTTEDPYGGPCEKCWDAAPESRKDTA